MISASSIKFTKETVPSSKGMKKVGMADEIFYANGIEVCRNTMYMELYATIEKGGNPSNLRSKSKKSCDRKWSAAGLEKLLGTRAFVIRSSQRSDNVDFWDSYPDTTWGDPGTPITLSAVKAQVESYIARNSIKLSNVFENWSLFLQKLKQPKTIELYRSFLTITASIGTDYDGTIKVVVNKLLSNFAVISGYMLYTPDEVKGIQAQIGTANQKLIEDKLCELYASQSFDMAH